MKPTIPKQPASAGFFSSIHLGIFEMTNDQDIKKAQEAATSRASSNTKTVRHLTKRESILKIFVERGERGLNCFEAANHFHDYVLRSTVSDLQRDYDIHIARESERVPNAFGKLTTCARYWLDSINIAKAKAILSISSDINNGGMA